MITKYYKHFSLQFSSNSSYELNSTDNVEEFENKYFEESEYILPSVFGIRIFENDILINSAVLGVGGGATTFHETSQILFEDILYICCGNYIFCLSIPELKLIWKTQADEITCFQIFKVESEFIIHGEMEISKLNENGNIIWQRGGRDIFVTQDGVDDFSIKNDIIFVKDWENNLYKFDLNGNEIQ